MDHSTLTYASHQEPTSLPSSGGERAVLVVVWSVDEPAHLGELLSPPLQDTTLYLFGRGKARGQEDYPRLDLRRERPGRLLAAPPLTTPTVSREQLLLQRQAPDLLWVRNIGQCPLKINGQTVKETPIRPGDLLELSGQLQLLCVFRQDLTHLPPEACLAYQAFAFGQPDAHGLVGESPALWELRNQVAFAAPLELHVLLQGESGTGKELAALAIHGLSRRGPKPLISYNAANFPETLIDAELFGNIKNFPNVGTPERPGLIGQADGSTLFLDEIGELPVELQAHLLRVLDHGEYQRLGEATPRRSDFRLLGATNRPPERLKHDFQARLKYAIRLPTLQDRREDIPLIVRHLLSRLAEQYPHVASRFKGTSWQSGEARLAPTLMALLLTWPYTTHVRELESLLWKAIAASRGPVLDAPPELQAVKAPRPPAQPLAPTLQDSPLVRELSLQDRLHLEIFRQHGFSVAAASADPRYAKSRVSADLHLRVLLYRALRLAEWQLEAAAVWVAGPDPLLQEKVVTRMHTRLERLYVELQRDGEASLKARLAQEYKAALPQVSAVVDALSSGLLKP